KVYAVSKGGVLRHVATEAVASALFGATWNTQVNDIPDGFFVNYTIGTAINATTDYVVATELAAAPNIGTDKGIGSAVTPGPQTTNAHESTTPITTPSEPIPPTTEGTTNSPSDNTPSMTTILNGKISYAVPVPTTIPALTVPQSAPGSCATLVAHGDPTMKINIVFIADGGTSFDQYKKTIEYFFGRDAPFPNFLNRAPFDRTYEHFNFYSIWKEEDYDCASGSFDCEIKMRLLAEQCPIKRSYDGITVINPRVQDTGQFGSKNEACLLADPIPRSSWLLSNGEPRAVDSCPGMAYVKPPLADYFIRVAEMSEAMLHEWGHMIGDLPHPADRPTIMSYLRPNQNTFDAIEIAQLCQRIAGGSDVTLENCIGNAATP
ncbi:MAG: hypothetical protein V1723_01890, partial [Candidatus Uhrbacteria bacterium]